VILAHTACGWGHRFPELNQACVVLGMAHQIRMGLPGNFAYKALVTGSGIVHFSHLGLKEALAKVGAGRDSVKRHAP
jgi:hypothetical protein